MKEIWKDIEGYEGLYQVSNLGRVRSFYGVRGKACRILRLTQRRSGHLSVTLCKDKKDVTFGVHRLVAMAFVDGYQPGLVVNHKDENPMNNHYDNLEWVTREENNDYGTRNERIRATSRIPLHLRKNNDPRRKDKIRPLKGEDWRVVDGWHGRYKVSNLGRVSYLLQGHERLMCQTTNWAGYKMVSFCENGKRQQIRVHRLVAMAFVEGYQTGLVVNHIDENKSNNRWDNLEWVTDDYNRNYGSVRERQIRSRSKAVQMLDNDGNVIAEYESLTIAAQACNPKARCGWTIGFVCDGKYQTAYGHQWQWKDNSKQ